MTFQDEDQYMQYQSGQIHGLRLLLAITLEVAGNDTDTQMAVVQSSEKQLLEIIDGLPGTAYFQQGVTNSFTEVCKTLRAGTQNGQSPSFTALE